MGRRLKTRRWERGHPMDQERQDRHPAPYGAGEMQWGISPHFDADPARVEHALRERVKELNCLYAIARLAEAYPHSIDDLLNGVVAILPPSWQYPEITEGRIVFRGRTYRTAAFRPTRWIQSAAIRVNGVAAGEVSVVYVEERPPSFEGPFLQEERVLLGGIAERIGTLCARIDAEQELQESNRQLSIERLALQETNVALRQVLARIEDEKREIGHDIRANVEKILLPIIQALYASAAREQRKYIDLLRDNLEDLTSPFVNRISQAYVSLTPTEIQICSLIRSGMRTKEIAEIRGVSPSTINRHREHIRRTLGITNDRVNLVTHLQATMRA
jgi:DNA-binding CsgD family transcriptional regulator